MKQEQGKKNVKKWKKEQKQEQGKENVKKWIKEQGKLGIKKQKIHEKRGHKNKETRKGSKLLNIMGFSCLSCIYIRYLI